MQTTVKIALKKKISRASPSNTINPGLLIYSSILANLDVCYVIYDRSCRSTTDPSAFSGALQKYKCVTQDTVLREVTSGGLLWKPGPRELACPFRKAGKRAWNSFSNKAAREKA